MCVHVLCKPAGTPINYILQNVTSATLLQVAQGQGSIVCLRVFNAFNASISHMSALSKRLIVSDSASPQTLDSPWWAFAKRSKS